MHSAPKISIRSASVFRGELNVVTFFVLSPLSLVVVLSAVVAISHIASVRRHMYVHIIFWFVVVEWAERIICVFGIKLFTLTEYYHTDDMCARSERIYHTGNKEIWEDEIFAALFGSLCCEYETERCEICVMILEKMLFLKDDDDRHSRELGFRERIKINNNI